MINRTAASGLPTSTLDALTGNNSDFGARRRFLEARLVALFRDARAARAGCVVIGWLITWEQPPMTDDRLAYVQDAAPTPTAIRSRRPRPLLPRR